MPTLRGKPSVAGEKSSTNFYFQVIHPDALNAGLFANQREQHENIAAVIRDILGHGNENCLLPGQVEAEAARNSEAAGGLLFTEPEIDSFNLIAAECGFPPWNPNSLRAFSG